MPLGGAPKQAIARRAQANNAPKGGFPGVVRSNPAGGRGGGAPNGPFGATKAGLNWKPKNSTPAAPGPVQGPGAPDIESYLMGDTAYQGGISEIMAALARYNAQNDHQANTVRSAFDTANARMGEERTRALQSIKDDFGSRGLANSGLSLKAQADYDTGYNQRLADLNFDLTSNLSNLQFERANNEGLSQAEQARLRQAALARRAQQFNLGV